MLDSMAADVGQDQPVLLTAPELAKALGVGPSTVWNWTKRDNNPLRTVTTADGKTRFTWVQLEEFRRANPGLRGLSRSQEHAGGQDQGTPVATAPGMQVDELKSIARDLRNAANASIQAALEAARLAEETARSHRVQLEHFAQLVTAYDAALSNITASSSVND
jgi:hypothetical protein